MCVLDCFCFLLISRKDEIVVVVFLIKLKKEYYEEDLLFFGIVMYLGRWSFFMVIDYFDLYIFLYFLYLGVLLDVLVSYMCILLRIFIFIF